ncbi:EamA/RhaT family transporter [Phenylobacterium deserti]|uniref:EamA/RhaT family transporter n=1 Tax=Phenylobacterium deserti TaxID=1914756 RepID=A0A328A9G0_9CAUL|nr:EamA/RhaT family transporter [Phenylobacterium deserti]RAK51250.1 EamA/RhaT family transporter [Phenylobacterium deserti]
MLWFFLAAAAAPLQTARNAMQRGLVGEAGPWGATLVRFLFGLPFSILICAVAALLAGRLEPHLSWRFVGAVVIGATSQILATAALLVAMRRSGFAVATVMQQSSLPFAALFGLLVGDMLGPHAWAGVALTTVGLAIVSWPRGDQMKGAGLGAALGLGSGAAFAIALNGFRAAGLSLEPHHPIWSATATVCMAQALQSLVMVAALAAWRPAALRAVAQSWRQSLGAGFFGAAASACWCGALALAPAGPVRAVGVIEAPVAAAVGRRLFKERLSSRQIFGGALAAVGVALAALSRA